MNELEKLYSNLVRDGLVDANRMELTRFKGLFSENENYRTKVHTALTNKGFVKYDMETFEDKYLQKKNSDPNDQKVSEALDLKFSENTVSSDLFKEEKSAEYRAVFNINPFSTVPTIERDPDGQYLKGPFGDFINALPFGDFIDDQARAFGSGLEDADVVESSAVFMNDMWTDSGYKVEDAEKMLKQLQESRNTAQSDEGKKFMEVYQQEGGDAFAALKAMGASPSGAFETVTRSMSSMLNWESAQIGLAAAGTTIAAGAATGPGVAVGVGLALPAAMVAAGANTDMMISFANFFEEELGEAYTREDIKKLLEDPDRMGKIRNKALARGVSIAAVGSLTSGIGVSVGAKVFRNGRRGLRPTLEATAKVTPLDMAGGATGEALAQVTSGEKFKSGDVVLEGFLDPIGSLSTTAGSAGIAAASKPSYKINKGRTTKKMFLETVESMTDEQLKSANFQVKNDEEVSSVLDERMQAMKISEEITQAYGVDIDDEQKRRLSRLEIEKRNLENKKTSAAKDRLNEVNNEITEVLEIYKTKRDAIGVLSAPYYDRQVASVEDAQVKRKTREYQQYKSKAKKLAETMGLSVSDMHDAIGGYTLDDGTYVQELSSEVVLEGASYEQAIEYASVLGTITPETQESTIAGMVVGEGEGDASQYKFTLDDSENLEDSREVLDALNIDYSMNTDTGEITVIDFNNKNDADLNKKIATFAETLTEYNISYGEKYERIRSKYISADDRRTNLQQVRENSTKYGKSGESVRYIAEQGEKRNEEYIKKRDAGKPQKPEANVDVTKPVDDNVKNKFSTQIKLNQAKKWVRQQFYDTFYSGSGADTKTEEIIRGFRRAVTALQFRLENTSSIFNEQFRAETKKMSKKDALAYRDAIQYYLSGRNDTEVSPEMTVILDEMRSNIDGATQKLIDRLNKIAPNKESTQDLIKTLEANKGQYLHRAYSAFKDTKYLSELLSDPSMARASINDSYDRLVYETAQDQGVSIEEAKALVDEYLVDTFAASDRATLIGSLAEGRTSSPFLKKKNKNLTNAFRQLLGEINDPIYNYVNTMEKISSYIAGVEYQDRLSNYFIKTGMGTSKPASRSDKKLELSTGAFGPLTELYVSEEVYDAYQGMQKLDPVKTFKNLIKFQSAVKYGKTILSPTTTARNYISGVFIAALNGTNIIHPSNWKSAKKALNVAWTNPKNKADVLNEAQKLIEFGVLQDGGRSQELVSIINDIYAAEIEIQKSGSTKSNIKKFNDLFVKVYSFGDDFFKAMSYYSTTKKFVDSGMDLQTAQERAAFRVRKGQPTYSELPKNIRALRRTPLVGTFVSFPYLMTKAHKENLKFIAEDFKEGRTKMAIQHSLNMLGTTALTYGVAEASKQMFGISDEEDKALRDMGSDYYRDTKFLYLGKDEDTNEIKYLDINTIAPSASIQKPLQILFEDRHDRNLSDKMLIAGGDFLSPFLGADLTTNVLTGVLTGYEVPSSFNVAPRKVPGDNVKERIKWGLTQIAPGAYGNALRFARATGTFGQDEINPFTGKKYTVEDEFLALAGVRAQTSNWENVLQSYVRRENRLSQDYYDNAFDEAQSQTLLSNQDIMDAVVDYEEDLLEHNNNIVHQIEVARKIGLQETEIVKALEASGMSKSNIDNVMVGKRLELRRIGSKTYEQKVTTYRDYPEVAAKVAKNLDRFNYFISEKNNDGKVRQKLYEFAQTNAEDDEVVDYIWKSSESVYDRYATNFDGAEKIDEYKRSENLEKEYKRYRDIYNNYRNVMINNSTDENRFPAKALVDMVYEKNTEIKSLLLFKYLEGDHSPKNLDALYAMYYRITGNEVSDALHNLIKLRIDAYK
ncbi:MAG: hypothetical protein L7V85_07095 [Bacteroidia bacterium]|nr:hypothetical protein [Bacteroidia bacterium]